MQLRCTKRLQIFLKLADMRPQLCGRAYRQHLRIGPSALTHMLTHSCFWIWRCFVLCCVCSHYFFWVLSSISLRYWLERRIMARVWLLWMIVYCLWSHRHLFICVGVIYLYKHVSYNSHSCCFYPAFMAYDFNRMKKIR